MGSKNLWPADPFEPLNVHANQDFPIHGGKVGTLQKVRDGFSTLPAHDLAKTVLKNPQTDAFVENLVDASAHGALTGVASARKYL